DCGDGLGGRRAGTVEGGGMDVGGAVTDAAGRATIAVPTTRRGDLTVTARARDERGNEVVQQTTLWVTDGSFSDEGYGYGSLEVIADRASYRAGDTAQVLINVGKPGGYALFTIDGDRLFEHRLIPLTTNSNLQHVPTGRHYLPNVYVSVVTVQGPQFNQQQRMLRVSPQEFALNVSVTPDRDRYPPGDRATFTVRATDSRGQPADAEVSLGVVDESIYAIRPDRTMGGIQYFYRYQQNLVEP